MREYGQMESVPSQFIQMCADTHMTEPSPMTAAVGKEQ